MTLQYYVSGSKVVQTVGGGKGNLNDFSAHLPEVIGFQPISFLSKRSGDEPVDFFSLFVPDELQNIIVKETNEYATQKIVDGIVNSSITEHSILSKWSDVDMKEMKIFFGLLLWMGLDKKPSIKKYWSTSMLYSNELVKNAGMSRNRLEAILSMIHFSNNEECVTGDRLFKIQPLIDILNEKD